MMKYLEIILLVMLMGTWVNTHSCTSFCLSKNDHVFLCKNFDFDTADGFIAYRKAGWSSQSTENGFSWNSLYASITFCYENIDFPLGGMNEKGLVIEELSCPPFSVREDDGKEQINEFQWIQFHLDNCASVKEVIEKTDLFSLVPIKCYMHYILTDSLGDVAVIEFDNGKTMVYTNDNLPYHILSNNAYPETIKYLSHHQGFSGEIPIKKSTASCDRFVQVAHLLTNNTLGDNLNEKDCFSILDSVRQNDTQWQIVYEPDVSKIYFMHAQCSMKHCIDLNSFRHQNGEGIVKIDMAELCGRRNLAVPDINTNHSMDSRPISSSLRK